MRVVDGRQARRRAWVQKEVAAEVSAARHIEFATPHLLVQLAALTDALRAQCAPAAADAGRYPRGELSLVHREPQRQALAPRASLSQAPRLRTLGSLGSTVTS